ncbi:hypothetical protein [Alicyclobacillus suci]|uniref:hypothetical protein n=1 Tax=Alicyclobacillus suci TaxID=2816080 RepID=UPI001A8EFCCB|nr:hypothetical protein [Alicyclobacillus suci]
MTIVQNFKVVKSEWENEKGDYYYTITDGVQEKGEFATFEEADAAMLNIITNWRNDH